MPALAVIEDLSIFKYEYMDMNVPSLDNGQFRDIKVKEFLSGDNEKEFVAVLFYPADFTQMAREEIVEATNLYEELIEANCQVRIFND
jgi:alkyl hydroperoxide reductase subunit AhpC